MDSGKVNNEKQYYSGQSGQQYKGILAANAVDASGNLVQIVYRCSDVRFTTPLSFTSAEEIGVSEIQETNYSREELSRGSLQAVYTMDQADKLPSSRGGLWQEGEYTLFVYLLDTVNLDNNGKPTKVFTDVFEGVRISEKGGGVAINQQRVFSVDWIARHHLDGLQYKAKVKSANYPADPAVMGGPAVMNTL